MKDMDLPSVFHYEGSNIRYSLTGPDKPPSSNQQPIKTVVFVHGTPWSSAVFLPTIKALEAKGPYRILTYDLPGYGQSQAFTPSTDADSSSAHSSLFDGDTSVKFQAKALVHLLQHTQLDGQGTNPAPAVIAHDIAGTIVLRAHLLHGVDFDTMLLVDANTVLPWGDGFYKLARSEPRVFVDLSPGIFDAVVRAVVRSACYDPSVLKAGWEDVLARPWVSRGADDDGAGERQRSFVRQIAQANDDDVAEMLAENLYGRVRCDVKIVWGEQDKWIPREKVEDLMKRLPDGSVKDCAFIPDAGHLCMLDQPARFAIEVFDWLIRFGSPRSLITS